MLFLARKVAVKSSFVFKRIKQKPSPLFLLADSFIKTGKVSFHKQRLNSLDKLFIYYKLQLLFSFFTYKVLSYFEMFLFSILLNNKIVKYAHQIPGICFNSLVLVNNMVTNNFTASVGLYDHVMLLNKLAFFFAYQQEQQYYFSNVLTKFLIVYGRKFFTYRLNKS